MAVKTLEAHPAMLYERIEGERVRCNLCAHRCVIAEGKLGVCQVRVNREGELYTLVYGRAVSKHVDPVEKKPLYHFHPGSLAYSIATAGCNFQCQWCQNWQIAQMPREYGSIMGEFVSPEQIVAEARATNSRSIAYTYTEPTVFFEYAYDTACLAHAAGISNIYVTNGYMTAEMLEMLHPYLDAANVDLKSFRKKTYHKYVKAGLQPVLDSMKRMKQLGIWLEVTTLVVPEINDDPAELREAARFIAGELGADTPWHISRFHPGYKLSSHFPTPYATLQHAREIGLEEGLHYVYLGNVAEEADTRCHNCGALLIRRRGYWVSESRIREGCCPDCGAAIAGVWD